MLISVIGLTYRPGGFDVLADGLQRQTHQDYELICVDEVVSRRGVVFNYLQRRGVKVSHVVPSKRKCFPELPFNLINAYNTGLLLSTGEVVVILNDYTWLPPNCLEQFAKQAERLRSKTCISGVAEVYVGRGPEDLNGNISVWSKHWNGSPEDNEHVWAFDWVPTVFELFYSAFSYDLLQEINGFPECYDYHPANQINPLMKKVREVGGGFYVDIDNVCCMVEHRRWGGPLWHQAQKKGMGTLVERENCFDLKTHVRGILP